MENILDRLIVSDDQIYNGHNVQTGSVIERLEVAEFKNSIYQFPAFFPWKLYIVMAEEAEKDAIEFSKNFISKLMPTRSIEGKKIYFLRTENPDDALKYFQSIMSDFIFSYCALEAYTNFRIDSFEPSELDYRNMEKLTKKQMNIVKIRSADLTNKEYCLEEKLFDILPYFLTKNNILISQIDNFRLDFRTMTDVRNSLVHLKRLKIRTGLENGIFNTNKLWNNLIPKFKKDSITLGFYPAQYILKIINYIESSVALNHLKDCNV